MKINYTLQIKTQNTDLHRELFFFSEAHFEVYIFYFVINSVTQICLYRFNFISNADARQSRLIL